ncbi:hypothetical protein LCGC14_0369520 [marine sediment metagenome]|uniref:Uncharacterized protein n=1 Tax=marine sediment metagenome TaxID=412755 RepID=A0A0F9WDY2_9ZZZZ
MGRDMDIGTSYDIRELDLAQGEQIEEAVEDIGTTTVVDCPLVPVEIPGSNSSGAYTANDAMGTIFEVVVPRRGEIRSAIFFDLDDEGLQTDLEIFKHKPTQIASEAAWALSLADVVKFITELSFVTPDDHNGTQTFQLTNIGMAYTAPEGKLYIQAVTRGTPTIAVGAKPRIQLQIQSFDPDFREV